ncbi:hypothetical protein [Actinoplanes sp. RD1]|uniref:hypothetical protein n=1 Tax=Actinoplanes sp. RD1 TaxID=3064538 RepID=UPI002742775E|nr:hypothetical protein [Actinoplanes sp. RD1]
MNADEHTRGDTIFTVRHPDTVLVDELTAFLNERSEPSGADTVEVLMQLIAASGRPLLTRPTTDLEAEVELDRYGLMTARVTTDDGTTVQVYQPTSGLADLRIDITTDDGDDLGVAITVNGRPVLDAMTCTTGTTVPHDLQLNGPVRRR